MRIRPCRVKIKAMKEKPKPKAVEIEELPDAWKRFEKAFDTVMKAKPKPRPAKKEKGKHQISRRSDTD
jgi:hypothetical protein